MHDLNFLSYVVKDAKKGYSVTVEVYYSLIKESAQRNLLMHTSISEPSRDVQPVPVRLFSAISARILRPGSKGLLRPNGQYPLESKASDSHFFSSLFSAHLVRIPLDPCLTL